MLIGQTIGPYSILSKLGEGGMGEVYRARDTKLGREVAIKVLPAGFVDDPERIARFRREAQVLATLSHPNIGAIYGLEESAGILGLVLELVDGPTLAERIAQGPIPLDDALPIARQIAEALEAAHEKGVIHRDLKPANIKIRSDGTVKVLDFGLAKLAEPAGSGSVATGLTNSPTLSLAGTSAGVVLGTASYMSPEQARGKAVDRRADIWAFGSVLYEMLTGRPAFEGDDISDILASVLKTEPVWTLVPADAPPSVRRLLRRCLEKDPRRRLNSIGDARLELDENEPAAAATTVAAPPALPARRSVLSHLWPALAAIVVTAGIAAFMWPGSIPGENRALARLSILPPLGADLYPDSADVAISPDGRMVVFVVGRENYSETQLWVRPLESTTPRRIEAGDGAILPFWSPDSRRIGFFAGKKLQTVAAAGGRADVVADAPFGRGAVWGPSDVILFARDAGGRIYRVPASGGEPVAVTTLDATRKESAHRFPSFLPDGEHFLYAALPGSAGKFDIFAGSLRDGSRTLVGSMECAPVYAEPGWLLFARQGALAAQPFDPRTRRTTGDVVTLEDEPTSISDPATGWTASRAVSVSSSGTLAYFSVAAQNTTAAWLDAGGNLTGTLPLPSGHYSGVRISPSGSHAVLVRSTSRSESRLWLVDLVRGSAAPLSSGPGRNDSPVWSPDGSQVVFASDRDGPQNLFMKTIGEASPEQLFYRSPVLFKSPDGWSPDGKWIVIRQLDPETAYNIWLLPTSGTPAPVPYVQGRARDLGGQISPDGRSIAYLSEDSGRFELYAQSFPEPGRKIGLSTGGALFAWWARDGRVLIFSDADRKGLWQVDVEPRATLRGGAPRRIATLPPNVVAIDAMPDGQRFLAIVPERTGLGSVTVVRNWHAALEEKP